MTARARIRVVEELRVDMATGRIEATVINGEMKDARIILPDGGSLRLHGTKRLHELRRAIEELLGLFARAEVRFDWDEVAYIEEGGVRKV